MSVSNGIRNIIITQNIKSFEKQVKINIAFKYNDTVYNILIKVLSLI